MNAKTDAAGRPQSCTCKTCSTAWLGAGRARVILPITDPYVVHHGALGSFATVYLPAEARVEDALARLDRLPAWRRCSTARRRAGCSSCRGPDRRRGRGQRASHRRRHSAARHDLSGLDAPLRSHGGLSEQRVPVG